MPVRLALVNWIVVVAALSGCGGDDVKHQQASPPKKTALPRSAQNTVTNYVLKGVVKRVEKELEHVTIKHEAIPGFMDAMTMRFAYKDKTFLAGVQAGDTVQGTLRVQSSGGTVQEYELLDLRVKPAGSVPAAPDISRKSAIMGVERQRLLVGQKVPDFRMTSQDGSSITLSGLRGNVVVLTFIYTRCPLPDFCPLMDKKFGELAQRIAAFPGRASRIRLISVSFDPEHDTPELLRKHAQLRGATPPLWTFAVASHAELAKIGGALGLFFQPGDGEIAHNLCTAVVDPEGNLARLDLGTERNKWDTADLQKTIYSHLAGPRD